jgi:hypothetical protein
MLAFATCSNTTRTSSRRYVAACYPGADPRLDEGLATYYETIRVREHAVAVGVARDWFRPGTSGPRMWAMAFACTADAPALLAAVVAQEETSRAIDLSSATLLASRLGENDGAIELASRAARLEPGVMIGHRALATVLAAAGRATAAAHEWRIATAVARHGSVKPIAGVVDAP